MATLSIGLLLTSIPLRTSFSPQHSWASPFRAFLLPDDRRKVSLPLSAFALFYKTIPALYRRCNGLIPPGKPSSSFATQTINPGRRLSALLGLSTSQASPSSNPPAKASPLHGSLLTLEINPPYDEPTPESQGLLKLEAWLSPSEEGAGLYGLSHQRCSLPVQNP